ncbi:MAG: Zn-ribbon domain-containing OB-fold protein [Candidatus Nezhaarchaeales archaeon]
MVEEVKPRIVEYELKLPFRWSMGPVATRFFEEFKNKRIMGTRCPKCRRVLVPARMFCPRCFVDTTEWVEVSDKGTIRTFTIITFSFTGQVRKPPYIVGVIDLDGADVGFTHFIGGVDLSDLEKAAREIKPGMRVQAVWREDRKGEILDIDYFKPIKE